MSDGFEARIEARQHQKHHALHTEPIKDVVIHGNLPNTPLMASIISFLLGSTLSLGLFTFFSGGFSWWATYQLGFFLAAWAAFHWGEYAVTAGWNLEKCSVDSFLLDNGAMYHIANGTAVFEYIITSYFKPEWKTHSYFSSIGILLVMIGQALRSSAMIYASTNFSHSVAYRKRESHELVTSGVYSVFRHPSYAGFFYWALGTQMVLQNPICFILFFYLLWKFFYQRTRGEEKYLTQFFPNEYPEYRRRVGTWIPFVP
ncbi:protein-s-isoprenylcysteine o-methyltransferase [Moniliophthora roreri MCA 2997]|uniref:Protein-S-isoprenylcysteine O-methyltransferase n=2 Tax=Moniliophthora roreri TaxID=221103 RepID=V2XTD3_MONRO|nr:protein-s-isoprenylcysteine o-methyltransferase [Moniliophthora roreri MCA 2997]KAI3612355.1 protein-s-isoprenylcysteine o-methyltransferase [Moniliophthora roreri]